MKDKSPPEPSERRRFSVFSKPLSDTLTQVVKPVYKKHGFAEHRILTQWHEVVGPELAACSLPQKLSVRRDQKEGGTLHVLVASARALELQHLQPVILDRIATYFGYRAVSRLAFTQTSSPLFRKETGAAPKQASGQSAASFAALAAGCEDESLRKALESLADTLAAVEN